MNRNTAIVSLGKNGSSLAAKLHDKLDGSRLYLPERFCLNGDGLPFTSVKDLLPGLFAANDALVLFMPAGSAVRLLAPLLKDKYHDPAVVIVDEAGKFAVSLLSGHAGGANVLALQVASALGAQPVITSAAESLETLAVDLLGRQFGWQIEDRSTITRVSAAIIDGEPVAIFQEAGEDVRRAGQPLSRNISVYPSLDMLKSSGCTAAVVITDRIFNLEGLPTATVLIRPRSLVVGIGFHHGLSAGELETALLGTIERHHLSPPSMRLLATIDSRRDENGLLDLAKRRRLPVQFFPTERLRSFTAPNPSATVARYVGAYGVCEPAAMLASNGGPLVVEKQKLGKVAIAIARYNFDVEQSPQ